MARIKVKRVSDVVSGKNKSSADRLKDQIAEFTYLYPRYSYAEALNLPLSTVRRLTAAARREQARVYLELAQIARISQAEKPAPYKELINKYQKEMTNG